MADEPKSSDDDWIEKVVSLAGALGLNQMRVRWKLIRWQESRRKARRFREQRIEHIRYQHKICQKCGAIQDKAESICTACDAKLGWRGLQVLQRLGLRTPLVVSTSALLALAALAAYIRVWVAAGGGLGSPSAALLYDFGGHWRALAAEPWRLVTSVFLHAGLWHLAFNLIALATIGPKIEEIYGRLTMLMLFIVTGTLANVGSELTGLAGIGVGASGGVMGLIGVAAGYGHRNGTSAGLTLRNDMLRWAGYTIILGFAIGADNRAHLFGVLLGAAFGYAVRPRVWGRPALRGVRVVGKLAGVLGATGALVLIFTRTPAPREPPPDPTVDVAAAKSLRPVARLCGQYYGGNPAAALAAAKTQLRAQVNAADFEDLCDRLYNLRADCYPRTTATDAASRALQSMCEEFGDDLAALPERSPPP